jgi:hypothetical protein
MSGLNTQLANRSLGQSGRRTLALLCVAVVIITLLPARALATPDGIMFGARVAPRAGESPQAAVQRFEAGVGRDLDVVREFLVWDSEFPSSYHTWLRDTDRMMILSVRSRRGNGTTVSFADVAAAQPGSALHNDIVRWADRMRDYNAPVYFTYNHEPESSASFPMGDAPEFIAAWRKVYQIFQDRGATNVKFMWIMTDYAFWVGSQARNDAGKWYPGDDYLEAMGADAYNWYNCRPGINNPWKTLEQIIRPFRDFGAAHPNEEMWLAEFASSEDTARPGRKAEWVREVQALFKRPDYAQFHGISAFNYQGTSTCHWFVDSSTSSAAAYRELGQDGFYGGSVTPPPTSEVRFVAAASSNANRTQHTVQVPASVQAGDTLLLIYTANVNATTTTAPPGWSLVRGVDPAGLRSRLWTRQATAGDAGSNLTVASSSITKADLKIVAYRGTGQTPLDVHADAVDLAVTTQHTAPSVTPTQAGDEILVYWADKSSTNTDHAIPASLSKLAPTSRGSGGGYITATIGGASAGAAGTPTGTFVATGTGPASRAVMYTIALRS